MKDALRRLQRIERLRAIAKQTAATEAAAAEATRAQLAVLAERTALLAADYARADGASDGAALALNARFGGQLESLCTATRTDATRAQELADDQLAKLAEAERRRATVEERIAAARRRIAHAAHRPALGAPRKAGTSLDWEPS